MAGIRNFFRNLISRLVGSNNSPTSYTFLQEKGFATPQASTDCTLVRSSAVNETQEKNEPLCLDHISRHDSKHPKSREAKSGRSDAGPQTTETEAGMDTVSEIRQSTVDETLAIAIIGPAGSGKSATGNTILGRNAFESKRSMATTTKCTTSGETMKGRKIIVIDTPPLPDTRVELSCEGVAKELHHCIKIAKERANGLDAIVLTINANGRFTQEIINGIKFARNLFGKKFVKFLIIIFTRKDQFSSEDLDLEQWLHSDDVPNYLKRLFKDCENRVLTINNKAGSNKNESEVNKITELIDKMKNHNNYSLDDVDVMGNRPNAVHKYEKACMEMRKRNRKIDSISFSEQCCIS